MQWLFLFIVFLAGALIPIQTAMNARLGAALHSPYGSTTATFFIGGAFLLVFLVVSRTPLPSPSTLASAPIWSWLGGVLAVAYVLVLIMLMPRLGASTAVAMVVAGQIISAVIIDHFGCLGFARHSFSPLRMAGLVCLLVGTGLIRKG
jgi:transporter family-2 protein